MLELRDHIHCAHVWALDAQNDEQTGESMRMLSHTSAYATSELNDEHTGASIVMTCVSVCYLIRKRML
jgi:hypothetical protein